MAGFKLTVESSLLFVIVGYNCCRLDISIIIKKSFRTRNHHALPASV